MLDLSQNFNNLGPPKGYIKFLKENFNDLISKYAGNSYGVIEMDDIEDALNVNSGGSLLALGATQAIQLISENVTRQRIITLKPTFWEYKYFNKDKSTIKEIDIISKNPLERLRVKLAQEKSSLIFICNPNNPTGHLFKKEYLLEVIRTNKKHIFVVDETYLHFSDCYDKVSLSEFTFLHDNLYVIQSLSKIFAVPGLRIGLLLSSKKNIQKIKQKITPYSISLLQLESCKYLLIKEARYLKKTQEAVLKNKNRIEQKLKQHNISYVGTCANFIFLRPKNPGFKKCFLKNDISVRYCEVFGDDYKNFVRIKLWDKKHDERIFEAL